MPKKIAPSVERRECDNCGNWYDLNPQVPNKKFCKDACRKEFWHTGGQFRKVTRYIDRRLPVLIQAAFDKQRQELQHTLDEIQQEREHIQGLVARFERARRLESLVPTQPVSHSGAAA